MVTLTNTGVYVINGALTEVAPPRVRREEAARGAIARRVLAAHNRDGGDGQLRLRFDSLTSHDITYVGIIQTARASGMAAFPMPYVLTNCHNSLCAVGGTINEDDHMFALSAAQKYGGVYVPPNMAVIHTYNREMMTACGRMILGSDSHTRYGAMGTMGVGEGGGELAKQLVNRTYDFAMPPVVAVWLEGAPAPGVGPQDVALAIIRAVYANGYVKNKVMEFIGPGVAALPMDFRNGVDVMTTETACWSSIWQTDDVVAEYYALLGRPNDYRELRPDPVTYYDGCVRVDLSRVEPMIALPLHPSNAFSIRELTQNAGDILRETERECDRAFAGSGVRLDLLGKLRDGRLYVDQGVVAGCSGGTYDNLCAVAGLLKGRSCGNGRFRLSVYPGSMPVYAALLKAGALADLVDAGAVVRECFCGPCFGAGETPANGELSIRHTTRNFPNREGSKPGEGQLAGVALMDARSIAATAANGGRLTAATEAPGGYPAFYFNRAPYDKRVLDATGNPDPAVELAMGPNIKDWPAMPRLTDDLLLKIVSRITDPVTTTDELIPSGETSSLRSNPLRLAEYTLSRKDPGYVARSKAVYEQERRREAGEAMGDEVMAAYRALAEAGVRAKPADTEVASALYAHRPGDGSAREQAASCQRVLGGGANIAREYATKRYRTNCVNWGLIPFRTEDDAPFEPGTYVFVPGVREAIQGGAGAIPAYAVLGGAARSVTLLLDPLTDGERAALLAGSLINSYREA